MPDKWRQTTERTKRNSLSWKLKTPHPQYCLFTIFPLERVSLCSLQIIPLYLVCQFRYQNLPLLVERVSLCSLQIITLKVVYQFRYCYKMCPCYPGYVSVQIHLPISDNKQSWLLLTYTVYRIKNCDTLKHMRHFACCAIVFIINNNIFYLAMEWMILLQPSWRSSHRSM